MLDPVAASGSAEVLLTQSLPALADYLGRSVALMLLAGLLILKADMARRIVISTRLPIKTQIMVPQLSQLPWQTSAAGSSALTTSTTRSQQ